VSTSSSIFKNIFNSDENDRNFPVHKYSIYRIMIKVFLMWKSLISISTLLPKKIRKLKQLNSVPI